VETAILIGLGFFLGYYLATIMNKAGADWMLRVLLKDEEINKAVKKKLQDILNEHS